MWNPTHVQVTVLRARNLLAKGKHGGNDVYVTIQLGKEKYQTSVQERSTAPEWHEECDLHIPDMLNNVKFTAFNRSFLGLDDFLGQVSLPLEQFPIYERPRSRWFALKPKSGKKDDKYRGEIEIKLTFIVQNLSDSVTSLNKPKIKQQRSGSIINLASSMGEKLKLPARSNSLKGDKKKNPLITNDDADSSMNSDETKVVEGHDPQETLSIQSHDDAEETSDSHQEQSMFETVKPKEKVSLNPFEQNVFTEEKVEDNNNEAYSHKTKDKIDVAEVQIPQTVEINIDASDASNLASDVSKDEDQKINKITDPYRLTYDDLISDTDTISNTDINMDPGVHSDHDEPCDINERPVDVAPSPLQRRYSSRKRIRKPKRNTPNSQTNAGNVEKDGFVHTNEGPVDKVMYDAFTEVAKKAHSSPKQDKHGRRLSFPTIPFSNKSSSKNKHSAEFPSYNPPTLTSENSLTHQNQFSTSEADLYTKWKAAVEVKEESNDFTKNRQPIYRAPQIKKATSESDMNNRSVSDKVPLLNDVADGMNKSQSGILSTNSSGSMDNSQGIPYWVRSNQPKHPRRSDAVKGTIIEEQEETASSETAPETSVVTHPTVSNKKQSKNDPQRRNTVGISEVPKMAVHKLHDTANSTTATTSTINNTSTGQSLSSTRKHDLPQKFIDQYEKFSKEDLLQVLYVQCKQIDKNGAYVRDLESYIDNLLVRVMESTPKLLQNPYLKSKTRPKHNIKTDPAQVNGNASTTDVVEVKVEAIPPQGSLANPVFIPTSKNTVTQRGH